MKTVKDISKLTGISIRTLRYYDEIGLLKPTKLTEAGYRLYDDNALAKLEEILFFKELDLSLQDIKDIIENQNYSREQILTTQKILLEHKRNRLNGIIELIDERLRGGIEKLDFERFNEDDAKQIIEHSLKLQPKASVNTIIEKYGSISEYYNVVASNITDETVSAKIIKIYGSKDKAMAASLKAAGNKDKFVEMQKKTDEIYKKFADAKLSGKNDLVPELVRQLAENHKMMFSLDSARALLLEIAKSYKAKDKLTSAADNQYGEGVAEFVADAINNYYGI